MNNLFKLPLVYISSNAQLIIWLAVVDVLLFSVVIAMIIVNRSKAKQKKQIISNDDWLLALGGKENIKEITAVGSRLSINLENKEIIDREKLKTLGVSSILTMSNKVTLVIEGQAEKIAESLKGLL